MGNKLDKFLLLMWKNFLLQWRHPKQTLVEILAPVLFSLLLVAVRSLVHPEPHSATLYTPFKNSLPANKSFTSMVAWSPKNPTLEKIMDNVVKSIYEKNKKLKMKQIGFDNRQALEKYLTNELTLLTTIAGIEFDDSLAGSGNLTSNLDITFRFPSELRNSTKGNWKTKRLFPTYQVAGPREWTENEGATPSYYLEGFLMLQQELSFAIIDHFKQKIHNKPFDHNSVSIHMQRFPYPKWIQDDLLTAMQSFVGLIIMLSFVHTCISTVKIITTEKEKQLKEAMKIMGLPNWLHWTAWFVKTFTILTITIIIIVALMKARWYSSSDHTVFTYSNPMVIFLFLELYVCATITFCFCISVFFSKANTAATVAGMAWFLTHFPYTFLNRNYDGLTLTRKLSASLFSNTAMAYGFQIMLMYEGSEEGMQWHNIWKTTSPDDTLVLGHLMLMLVLDTILYLLITLYVEAVFPGEYGVPLPWNFPFTASYWWGNVNDNVVDVRRSFTESEFYESEPTHLQVGIKVQHLHKEFSNKVAVKDLSLNMYKDQITVLLGHNGAGKTTTMSMLTGMFPPTSGTAIVGGYDIRKDMTRVRESLGLCPQHNILFDELTVREHLYFYSRLKGLGRNLVEDEINKYVDLLELQPKKNAKSSELSGGMKRKLSVAVALCGGSKVVMCDEPTAGMDPAARRALWDLLLSQKKGRTILLSTHYMDEADLLGDRIAIMAGGDLQCCGSSFFLKKKYGAGYHLVMDKSPQCNVDDVTKLLEKYIPNIHVESNVGSELRYLLSEEYSSIFEMMLSDLEVNSEVLGILSYGISLTTLEEVFMKVGTDHGLQDDEVSEVKHDTRSTANGYLEVNQSDHYNIEINSASEFKRDDLLTGFPLWYNQLLATFMKRSLSVFRSWILFLIQNSIPVIFLILAIISSQRRDSNLPNLKIELNSYDNPVTVLTRNTSSTYSKTYINYLSKNNKIIVNWENANMTKKMLEESEKNIPTIRQRYISGASFDGKSITAWFNNQPYHSPPLSLQMVLNAILHEEVSSKHNLQFNLFPLPYKIDTQLTKLSQGQNAGFQIAFNLGFSMAFVSAFYVMFYIKERVCKAKHLQFVSGISVLPFWLAAFVCDLLTFIFTSILVIITLAIFQEDGFKTVDELSRIFSILLYFGFSMLPMMYLASYLFDIPSTGYSRMAMINIFTGVAAFLVVQILSNPELKLQNTADTLHWIFLLVPHYSFSASIRDTYVIYSTRKLCNFGIETCVNLHIPGLTPERCEKELCKRITQCCNFTIGYYDIKPPGIGRNILYSCGVGIILISVIFILEFRIFEKILYMIRRENYPPVSQSNSQTDSDVLEEKIRIKNASMKDIENMNLVMRDVTKYYNQLLAVDNICLGVNKYECFGLLGVNGAGKTTTFKILTGDIRLSSGDAWVNGLSLKRDMKKIHQLIGYCPQFDALLDDLTGRETLIIFSLLRGMTLDKSKVSAESLAHELDFHKHLDKKVKEFSGGNKRKLSTALALLGDPLVIYLDEPTAGMDPATKRYLWNALCKIRDSGKCIVLTSHSMEECEALCTRLAIMVNGAFLCLGSTQHLKSKFSEGYTLTIKIRKTTALGDVDPSEWRPIEAFVEQNFPGATIRERHLDLITFYIADSTLPWSRMFGIMEEGKNYLDIEDYSLGQCSLEQVFLTFTKQQRQEKI
ncbi:hypothetical protein ILUMI_08174 [Ignelater luminosus]|uniref:ABC transporter domain-containing protein n=1 Tax=Ignelater luminosus TaxID=2038154 RepID=A0A8K0DBV1_IGNLU|nr:hypothetical protein ILUMI_08174 [Ignelater luminosus]